MQTLYSLFPRSFCLNIQYKALIPQMGGSEGIQGNLSVWGFAQSDTRSVGLTEVASVSCFFLLPASHQEKLLFQGKWSPFPSMFKSRLRNSHLISKEYI